MTERRVVIQERIRGGWNVNEQEVERAFPDYPHALVYAMNKAQPTNNVAVVIFTAAGRDEAKSFHDLLHNTINKEDSHDG